MLGLARVRLALIVVTFFMLPVLARAQTTSPDEPRRPDGVCADPSCGMPAPLVPPSPVLPRLTLDPPSSQRHVGLLFAAGPGSLFVDFDYKHFYGFVGMQFGYAGIFTGGHGDSQYVSFGLGAGPTWRIHHSNWSFHLVALATPTIWGGFSSAIGVGAGFHYTAPNGFTASFTLPIIGVAPGCNVFWGGYDDDMPNCEPVSGASLLTNFYMESAMSLPTLSIGYRF